MSPGFRRKASHSTHGLVRETAKVGGRTDTSRNPAESVEPLLLHKRLDGFEGDRSRRNVRLGPARSSRALHHLHPRNWRPAGFRESRPRAVCTTVDRLRYSLYESLFDGSKGK